jgi:hypothetical protein
LSPLAISSIGFAVALGGDLWVVFRVSASGAAFLTFETQPTILGIDSDFERTGGQAVAPL